MFIKIIESDMRCYSINFNITNNRKVSKDAPRFLSIPHIEPFFINIPHSSTAHNWASCVAYSYHFHSFEFSHISISNSVWMMIMFIIRNFQAANSITEKLKDILVFHCTPFTQSECEIQVWELGKKGKISVIIVGKFF